MVISQIMFFFFKQKTAYEMRISDWSSDVCSSDLAHLPRGGGGGQLHPCRRTAEPQPVGGEPPDLGPRGQPEGAPLPPPCPRPHPHRAGRVAVPHGPRGDRKSTRLNSSH